MRIWTVALASLVAVGCATSSPPTRIAPSETFGLVPDNPVEVCEPSGEQRYLARLVCQSGQHPEFKRRGNVGPRTPLPAKLNEAEEVALVRAVMSKDALSPGSPDYHWIDAYEVNCGAVQTTIYMDMYHCEASVPRIAPSGFTITN